MSKQWVVVSVSELESAKLLPLEEECKLSDDLTGAYFFRSDLFKRKYFGFFDRWASSLPLFGKIQTNEANIQIDLDEFNKRMASIIFE